MLDVVKYFYEIYNKIPDEGQRVIVYNSKLDEFIIAVFKNGKFFENGKELINISKWKEYNGNNISF